MFQYFYEPTYFFYLTNKTLTVSILNILESIPVTLTNLIEGKEADYWRERLTAIQRSGQ